MSTVSFSNFFIFLGEYTYLYANFTFVRRISGSIFNVYVPSALVVFLSWISFWLDIEAIPARITLGVTSLLTLSTQVAQAHSHLPSISYLTAMDVWLFACLIMVFSSLLEFALAYQLFVNKKQVCGSVIFFLFIYFFISIFVSEVNLQIFLLLNKKMKIFYSTL